VQSSSMRPTTASGSTMSPTRTRLTAEGPGRYERGNETLKRFPPDPRYLELMKPGDAAAGPPDLSSSTASPRDASASHCRAVASDPGQG
jgi:hypothetical protein